MAPLTPAALTIPLDNDGVCANVQVGLGLERVDPLLLEAELRPFSDPDGYRQVVRISERIGLDFGTRTPDWLLNSE